MKRKGRRISKANKGYQAYREKYYREKKKGNTKNGVRVLTPQQYRRAKNEGISDKKILEAQTILSSKAEEKKVWKEYTRIKKLFQRGEKYEMENTYFGGDKQEDDTISEGLGYHYGLSGLPKYRDALHFLISFKIDAGYDRAKVLADYGY